jgi:hypothetical protein
LNYAENMFRKYLKEFGVKEIITVENRVSRWINFRELCLIFRELCENFVKTFKENFRNG